MQIYSTTNRKNLKEKNEKSIKLSLLHMSKETGISAAIGNVRHHIKKLCDVVTADNDHGGCAEVIETYLLGL